MKNVLSDGKTVVDNYRQTLEKLCNDFLQKVIVTVEINVFCILAEVKSLDENLKEVNENTKEIKEIGNERGEHHILEHNLGWKSYHNRRS